VLFSTPQALALGAVVSAGIWAAARLVTRARGSSPAASD
jgi:hypothetical protein